MDRDETNYKTIYGKCYDSKIGEEAFHFLLYKLLRIRDCVIIMVGP